MSENCLFSFKTFIKEDELFSGTQAVSFYTALSMETCLKAEIFNLKSRKSNFRDLNLPAIN